MEKFSNFVWDVKYMPKVFSDKDVLTATNERLEYIFQHFDNYYFSVSGGKDSSVMLHLAIRKARQMHLKFSVLYVDFEAQYQSTIKHIEELILESQDVLERWYWVALPLSLRNAVSVLQPKWICWDLEEQKRWVRAMPDNPWVIHENNYPSDWTWFQRGMEFEQFILYFARWFHQKKGGNTACIVAIRSDESLNRFRTLVNTSKETFENKNWTTHLKLYGQATHVFSVFPLYDWKTSDIWTAVARLDLKFNDIYEQLYKNGVPLSEQRLCQPYGDDQRKGIDQFKALEYETWEKVLNRVHGVNFGNIYCRTSALGVIKTQKPHTMTWQQYTVFLLESLGLYVPELRDHYYYKIKTFLNWYLKKKGIHLSDIRDEEPKALENAKKVASWRRIARAIEHNDFWMKRLSFSQNKSDIKKLLSLQEKYHNLLNDTTLGDKDLEKISQLVNRGGQDV